MQNSTNGKKTARIVALSGMKAQKPRPGYAIIAVRKRIVERI
jgi:hypothetical protein